LSEILEEDVEGWRGERSDGREREVGWEWLEGRRSLGGKRVGEVGGRGERRDFGRWKSMFLD